MPTEDDHDRITKLETSMQYLREEQRQSASDILESIHELSSHWSQRCDIRHAEVARQHTSRLAKTSITIAAVGLFISAALALTRCSSSSGCSTGDTRCDGQRAEVCDAAWTWTLVLDCDELAARAMMPLRCMQAPEGAVCAGEDDQDASTD